MKIPCLLTLLALLTPEAVLAAELEALFPEPSSLDSEMTAEDYREYGRESLYDYIDGGAEVYLDLGFVAVGVREDVIDLDEETYFTIDVYDMGKPVNAFGIFHAELYGNVRQTRHGVAGYIGGGALVFWSQHYYIKVRADNEGEKIDSLLNRMADQVAARIGEPGEPPAELALFPLKDRAKASEKYARSNILGVKELAGFSCQFKADQAKATLYLCPYESDKEALAVEKAFVSKLVAPPEERGLGYAFQDKRLGQGYMLRAGSMIAFVKPGKGTEITSSWVQYLSNSFFAKLMEADAKAREKKRKKADTLHRGKAK